MGAYSRLQKAELCRLLPKSVLFSFGVAVVVWLPFARFKISTLMAMYASHLNPLEPRVPFCGLEP